MSENRILFIGCGKMGGSLLKGILRSDDILKKIKVFETISEALYDVSYVLALTARNRDITKFELSPEHAVVNIIKYAKKNEDTAILFGPEQSRTL